MAASKKIYCVICNKKCSGNVLRYQDQYYHKQCFELEQSQGSSKRLTTNNNNSSSQSRLTGSGAGGNVIDEPYYNRHVGNDYNMNNSTIESPDLQQKLNNNNNIKSNQYPDSDMMREQQINGENSGNSPLSSRSTSRVLGNLTKKPTTQEQQIKSRTLDSRLQQQQPPVRARGEQNGNKINDNNFPTPAARSATLPHSTSVPVNGFLTSESPSRQITSCAGCNEKIKDGQALIALERHWHIWCFKCAQCQSPLHAEYVAKDGRAYCEKDYQKLFGVNCVYCKRYITGKVLQAGEAHHFHPSCARCSKCGDPFVPGEEMYLQGEVTWHPRCGPGPGDASSALPQDELDGVTNRHMRAHRAHSPSLSSRSQSRSASPFSFISRQYGHSSPGYADSEAVGDLSRIYTISYLNADPTQGYLRRPIEPAPPKSPQFSRPASLSREPFMINSASSNRSRSSSRSQYNSNSLAARDRSVPRGMYSVLSGSGSGRSTLRARSPSMMNEEAIQLASYPSGQKPSPNAVPRIERDDFPAPPFPYPQTRTNSNIGETNKQESQTEERSVKTTNTAKEQQLPPQERKSRPKSREIIVPECNDDDDDNSSADDPQLKKEEQELSKIANGIGKIFLQTLKEREKLRAWKRANLDPRNASRTPSATRELPSRPLRYENPTNASPSRDMDRVRTWGAEVNDLEQGVDEVGDYAGARSSSPISRTTNSKLGGSSLTRPASQMSPSTYGYKVVQANRNTPKPGYGLSSYPTNSQHHHYSTPPVEQSHALTSSVSVTQGLGSSNGTGGVLTNNKSATLLNSELGRPRPLSSSSAHLRRSMPNVSTHHHHHHQIHLDGPPKLYPYHLLATSNYRLPPDVDRCHLERHLSNEEFQYIFHCDRLDFYRLPEWKRNELKRRAKLF